MYLLFLKDKFSKNFTTKCINVYVKKIDNLASSANKIKLFFNHISWQRKALI